MSEMASEKVKIITKEELKQHKDERSLWIAIHDKVYDVTNFLDEHPGGEEVFLEHAGKYATDSFEDVGHSSDALELMKDYYVGEMAEKEKTGSPKGSSLTGWMIPVAIVTAAVLVYNFVLV